MFEALESLGIFKLRLATRVLSRRQGLAMGRALGRIAWRLGLRRAVSLDNVRRALGDQLDATQREATVLGAYEHLGMTVVELLQLPRMSRSARRASVEFVGREHLDAALAAGRGAIVASAHYGNWEFLGAGGVAYDLPVTFVVQRLRNARIDAMLRGMRESLGIRVVERGMALRRLRDEIAANRLVAVMCDQDARRRGIFVPFFATPASTHKGAAQLAMRLDTPFIPLFGRRLADGRHRMVVRDPIQAPKHMREEDAIDAMMSRFNQMLEEEICIDPRQYLWMHRRWKTVPAPEVCVADDFGVGPVQPPGVDRSRP